MVKKSFKIRGNLAKALHDTVSSAKNNAGELHIEIIPLMKIELDPENPRDLLLGFKDIYENLTGTPEQKKRKLAEKKMLTSLVKSIREQGVINPVVVYKHDKLYRLIAGERRTLASIIAKKADIPARVLTKKPDALKLSLMQWIENIEREDLTLWERFRNLEKITIAYANNQSKTLNKITATDLSQLLGCSLQQGVNYRNILNASNTLKQHIQSGEIKNIEKAALIAKSSQINQPKLIQACINGNTLSDMKKIAKMKFDTFKKLTTKNTVSKIHFGSTTSMKAAKAILDSVTKNEKLKKHSAHIEKVYWDNPKSISAAFQKLVKSLEQS